MHGQKSMALQRISPTVGLNIAKLDQRGGEFVFWDVGGQDVLRKIWEKYFSEANGLIFVIDGSDEIRFNEVRETLAQVFARDDSEEGKESSAFDSLPVLFLLNKNDLPKFKGVD